MSQKNNDIIYTAADIEKYHKGLLSAKERHALEKAALDDPFLADSLEGYSIPSVNSSSDIAELKRRLTARIEENKERPLSPVLPSSFSWWKVAAMIIVIAGAGLLVYQFGFNNKQSNSNIARADKKESVMTDNREKNIATPDSPTTFSADSLSGNVAIQQSEKDINDKKTEPSAGLIAPGRTNENKTEAAGAGKGDRAEPTIPVTATAQAKTDDKENEAKKSLRNDHAVDKSITAEKSVSVKSEELSFKKKADADADGVQERFDNSVVSRSARTSPISVPPGLNQTNIFRGRVTDAHNNALPFSNITNLEDSVGTYSDARGYFNLTSPDSVLTVQVRSLGFESNNFQLRNNLPENKLLLEEDRSLNAKILDTVKRNTNRLRNNNNMVLEEPEPIDGWSNYDMYLVNNLKVPESFRPKQSGGEVELSFEVDKNGEPVNITVKKSLCDSCDKEAIRLLKEGPKWKRKIKKRKARVTISF